MVEEAATSDIPWQINGVVFVVDERDRRREIAWRGNRIVGDIVPDGGGHGGWACDVTERPMPTERHFWSREAAREWLAADERLA